jgi:hypothetical protein
LERKYPRYALRFGEGEINRVVSTFHAFRHDHHIIGEIHNKPQTTPSKMEQSLQRINRLRTNLNIEEHRITMLVFSPKPPNAIFTCVFKTQKAFERKNSVHFVLMPTREVFRRKLRRLRKRKQKERRQKKLERMRTAQRAKQNSGIMD